MCLLRQAGTVTAPGELPLPPRTAAASHSRQLVNSRAALAGQGRVHGRAGRGGSECEPWVVIPRLHRRPVGWRWIAGPRYRLLAAAPLKGPPRQRGRRISPLGLS